MRTPTMFFLLVLVVFGLLFSTGYLFSQNQTLRSTLSAEQLEHAAEIDEMEQRIGSLERENGFLRRELASRPSSQKQQVGAQDGESGVVPLAPAGANGRLPDGLSPTGPGVFLRRELLPFVLGAIISTSVFALLCLWLGLIRVKDR